MKFIYNLLIGKRVRVGDDALEWVEEVNQNLKRDIHKRAA
jgi:hypothetical protein